MVLIMGSVCCTQGRSGNKRPVETGTQGKGDIDYQWLPEGSVPGTPSEPSNMGTSLGVIRPVKIFSVVSCTEEVGHHIRHK